MKRLIASLVTAAFISTGIVGMTAGAAQAHSGHGSATCEGESLHGQDYDSTKANKVTMSQNGQVVYSGTFGASFDKTIAVPQGGATTAWSTDIQAEDGSYHYTDSGSVGPCGTPPKPADTVTHDQNTTVDCDTLIATTHHTTTTTGTELVNGQWVATGPVTTNDPDTTRNVTQQECDVPPPPAAEHQTRDVVDQPNCTNNTITTEHQGRDAIYTFNEAKWYAHDAVPYDVTYTDWKTNTSTTVPANLMQCPPPPKPEPVRAETETSTYECGDDHTVHHVMVTTSDWGLDETSRTWYPLAPVNSSYEYETAHAVESCPKPVTHYHPTTPASTADLPNTGGPSWLIGLVAMAAVGTGAALIKLRQPVTE